MNDDDDDDGDALLILLIKNKAIVSMTSRIACTANKTTKMTEWIPRGWHRPRGTEFGNRNPGMSEYRNGHR